MKWYHVIVCTVLTLLLGCQSNQGFHAKPKAHALKTALYHTQLGLAYLSQHDRARAKHNLLKAVDEAPDSPDVLAAMGYFMEQTGEFPQAARYYKAAIRVALVRGIAWNNYGAFLCRRGQYKDAITYFMLAVHDSQYEHTSAAYENAGLCAILIPDKKKALYYFKKALQQDPSRKQSRDELTRIEKHRSFR